MHSNTAAQDLPNPYSRPGNKGRNIIYLIHIPTHTSALEVFHGHVSDWTQADDFSLLVRKQDKKIQFVFCVQNEERDMSMSQTKPEICAFVALCLSPSHFLLPAQLNNIMY